MGFLKRIIKAASGGFGKQTTVVFTNKDPFNDDANLKFNTPEDRGAAIKGPASVSPIIVQKKPEQKWFPVSDYETDNQAFTAVKGASEAEKRQKMREKILREYGIRLQTLSTKLIGKLNQTTTEDEVRRLADGIIAEREIKLKENIPNEVIRSSLPRYLR